MIDDAGEVLLTLSVLHRLFTVGLFCLLPPLLFHFLCANIVLMARKGRP